MSIVDKDDRRVLRLRRTLGLWLGVHLCLSCRGDWCCFCCCCCPLGWAILVDVELFLPSSRTVLRMSLPLPLGRLPLVTDERRSSLFFTIFFLRPDFLVMPNSSSFVLTCWRCQIPNQAKRQAKRNQQLASARNFFKFLTTYSQCADMAVVWNRCMCVLNAINCNRFIRI